MDSSGSFDRSRFQYPEKELSSVLTTAQDSILRVTDDEANYSSDDGEAMFTRDIENKYRSKHHYDRNGNHYQAASTPLHPRALKAQNPPKYANNHLKIDENYHKSHHNHVNSKKKHDSKYVNNSKHINNPSRSTDIKEQQQTTKYYTMINDNNDDDEDFGDHYTEARSKISPKSSLTNHTQRHKENDYNESRCNTCESMLIENENLNKKLIYTNDRFTELSKNNGEILKRFEQMSKVNEDNLNVIDNLQAKIRHLESSLRDEVYQRQSGERKIEALEKQNNSLVNELQMYRQNDYYAKSAENEKFSSFKSLCYKEINEEMENKWKIDKEKLKNQYNEKINEFKADLKCKLMEDVEKIIGWLSDSVREHDMDPKPSPESSLIFRPLQELCSYLNGYLQERENRIQIQIAEFRETKTLLEDALVRSEMASVSVGNNSNNSNIPQELLEELEKLKEEKVIINKKLAKYKECYQSLRKDSERRHKDEIEALKQQFREVLTNKGKEHNSGRSLVNVETDTRFRNGNSR